MAVKVNPGEGEADLCIVRKHPHCTGMTDWWWGSGGCISLCFACAGLDEVTDASMRKLCTENGWGPLPPKSEDTTKPPHSERPRLVGKMSDRRPRFDNALTIVDFTCPNCTYAHTLAYGGWSAIGCPCGVNLARNKRSL